MDNATELFTKTETLMGTIVDVKIHHQDADMARQILYEVFKEMRRIVGLLTVYDDNSEIGSLNRKGFYKDLSRESVEVIRAALHYSRLSEGLFDISVLPALRLQQEAADKGGDSAPQPGLIKAHALIDYRNIHLCGNNIRFAQKGMAITLGGAAKGYIVDRAMDRIGENGVKRALINAGGDIRVMGAVKEPWHIGIRDPRAKRKILGTARIQNQAIASSGTYQRHFNDIIEPRHIIPERQLIASTIIAPQAMDADILATCMLLMGVERGLALIGTMRGVAALLVDRQGNVTKSCDWDRQMLKLSPQPIAGMRPD